MGSESKGALWIGNEWTPSSSSRRLAVEDPATEEVIGEVAAADHTDVSRATEAARRGQLLWNELPAITRAERLHEVARGLRAQREPLAELMTREGGKPLKENLDEVEWCAACCDYYAELGRSVRGRVVPAVGRHQLNLVTSEPLGVVACVVPWNYPLLLLFWKLAPALMAGNAVVVKPSELTPLSTLKVAELFHDFPPGAVNVVTGNGETGEALVSDPLVDCIAFTGSFETGRRIASIAAQTMKKVNLELSGNDPFIVFADADVDIAARGAVFAAFLNSGQVCTSAKRLYVERPIAEQFIEHFVAHTRALRLGNGREPLTDIGPHASARQREKFERAIEDARSRGATILAGGRRPEHLAKGFFYEPTVLTNVDHSFPMVAEETFGPAAPIMVVDGLEDAIRKANDSPYGLGANIYTRSLETAMTAMERIKAGTFWINEPLTDNDAAPFGGMKRSGIGRELGSEGLAAFQDVKHAHINYVMEAQPDWFPYGRR